MATQKLLVEVSVVRKRREPHMCVAELTNQVEDLKREHEQFRVAVRKVVVRLDLASPARLAEFDTTCAELRNTINQILEHIRREQELLVESFDRDTGGEA